MADFTRVNDEDVIEVFNILQELLENGPHSLGVWFRVIGLQEDCIKALRGGSDNLSLAEELENQLLSKI